MKVHHQFEDLLHEYQDSIKKVIANKGIAIRKLSAYDQKILFEAAGGFYRSGRYENATLIFKRLTLSSPLNPTYWQSLASSLQMNKEYNEGLYAWSILLGLDKTNALFFLRCAECYLQIKDITSAKEHLKQALDLAGSATALKKEIENVIGAWELEI